MPDPSDTELLSYSIAVACVLLLYCVWSKNKSCDGFSNTSKHHLEDSSIRDAGVGSIKFREGIASGHAVVQPLTVPVYNQLSKISPRDSQLGLGYVSRGYRDGMDTDPVASMHDLTDSKWNVDMSIQIDQHAATPEDMLMNNLLYGHEQYSVATPESLDRRTRLGRTEEIRDLTSIGADNAHYGWGHVTYP